MSKVHEPTIDERIEQYWLRLKRRLFKHIRKNSKKIQTDRKNISGGKSGRKS